MPHAELHRGDGDRDGDGDCDGKGVASIRSIRACSEDVDGTVVGFVGSHMTYFGIGMKIVVIVGCVGCVGCVVEVVSQLGCVGVAIDADLQVWRSQLGFSCVGCASELSFGCAFASRACFDADMLGCIGCVCED